MIRRALAAALACLIVSPSLAAGDAPTAIERAEQRGTLMFWLDRAAWVTSDDLLSRLPAERSPEIGGWIVTQTGAGYHADYFGKGSSAERIVYSADVEGGVVNNPKIFNAADEPALSGVALAMTRALASAREEMKRHPDWQPCEARPFNTIVLPPDAAGTISVYFLTPQVTAGVFPLGGHYEVDIGREGQALSSRAFTKACLPMKSPEKDGAKPAGIFITHLLDSTPTEVHVFEQYGISMPLYVGIAEPRSVWKVENGAVQQVAVPGSR